jgi:phage shock protein B
LVHGLSIDEQTDLEEMMETANKMAQRIQSLELILDSEHPQWREK